MTFLGRLWYGDAWRTDDAEDRRVPLYDPCERVLSASSRRDFPYSEFKGVRVAMRRGRTQSERFKDGALWWSLLLVLLMIFPWTAPSIVVFAKYTLLWGCLLAIGWAVFRRFYVSIRPLAFAEAMLKIGRCPSCAYRMAGAPGASEKWTCPECGAAWHKPHA